MDAPDRYRAWKPACSAASADKASRPARGPGPGPAAYSRCSCLNASMNVDACMKVMRMPAARATESAHRPAPCPRSGGRRGGDMAARDGAEQAVARQIARHVVARHAARAPPPAGSETGRRPPAARGNARQCPARPGMEQRASDLDRVIRRGQGARETSPMDVRRTLATDRSVSASARASQPISAPAPARRRPCAARRARRLEIGKVPHQRQRLVVEHVPGHAVRLRQHAHRRFRIALVSS